MMALRLSVRYMVCQFGALWISCYAAVNMSDTSSSGPEHQKLDPMKDMSGEKRLVNKMLSNYQRVGKVGRPVLNISTTIVVHFGLGLIQLALDEKDNFLTLSMWTKYQWRDEYMTWDPDDYDGVTAIRLEPDLIWRPDIMLYNTADVEIAYRNALAVVTHAGDVSWFPHTIFKSSCSVDVVNFPFDRQHCHMWFGSWTHDSREIDLRMGLKQGIDLSTFKQEYRDGCGWEIENVTASRETMPNEHAQPHFVVLTFNLNLRRKMVFSTYILTLPCVFLACLTLVVFWLPPDRPDRTALGMSTFASFMVLLLILVEAAPPTASAVPTLGVYYCFNMVIIMLSIILSSLVVNISRGGSKGVPAWLSRITIGGMARYLCIEHKYTTMTPPHCKEGHNDTCSEGIRLVSNHEANNEDSSGNTPQNHGSGSTFSMINPSNENTFSPLNHSNENSFTPLNHSNDSAIRALSGSNESTADLAAQVAQYILQSNSPSGVPLLKRLTRHLQDVHVLLRRVERRTEESGILQRQVEEYRYQWTTVARILDRFFFVSYLILIVGSLSLLFPRPS